MKSNEEFIAGIYEKAAVYAEAKEENKKTAVLSMPALRMAAMLAVCVGLLGIGTLALHRVTDEDTPKQENIGIARFSADMGEETPGISALNFRGISETETELLKGTVEFIDREEKIIWIILENTDGSPEENRIAAVKWDITEKMPSALIEGTELMAEGIIETYSGADTLRSGSIKLTLADIAKLWLWNEETDTYRNCNNEERK